MQSIDFARYLSIWILDLKCEESVFWRSMNPMRLHALYNSYFKQRQPREIPEAAPADKPKSLAEYLRGGGS